MKFSKVIFTTIALSLSFPIFAAHSLLDNTSNGGLGVFSMTVKSSAGQPECDMGNGRKGILIDDLIIYTGKNCSERAHVVIGKTCMLPYPYKAHVTSDRLQTLIGAGQACAKFDVVHLGQIYSSANIQLTWNENYARYESGMPADVTIQLP